MKRLTSSIAVLCAMALFLYASCENPVSDDSTNWYKVTFSANGGTGTMAVQRIESGSSATLTANAFTRGGYTFAGWATDEYSSYVAYSDGAILKMGIADVTLFAVWADNLTVTFNANGGMGTMPAQTIASGSSAALNANAFTREGFTFTGWATTADAKKAAYSDKENFTMKKESVTLYAIWAWKAPSLEELKSGGYIAMVDIPTAASGAYTQATSTSSGFVHDISPFSLGKYEVTYELWYTVSQWGLSHGYGLEDIGREGSDGVSMTIPSVDAMLEPVTGVSWRICIVWCNAFSEMAGKTPVYYCDAAYTAPMKSYGGDYMLHTTAGNSDNPYVKADANGYRLPTGGEWQFAASCGGIYPYDYASGADAKYDATTGGTDIDGDGDTQYSDAVAWHEGNSSSMTHTVGTKAANKFGLYDMSGNVWEWCFDWTGSLPTTAQADYAGPVSGSYRVVCGGTWARDTFVLQIGDHAGYSPYWISSYNGFRVCYSR